ncbi:MAG: acyltransferase [Verrucomicrobia bacterium]|jgi:acetyltransferase-like isoleucine patch superfamily enzyme|nr:acyltransferase [Verrucomicrobiota bacterium]
MSADLQEQGTQKCLGASGLGGLSKRYRQLVVGDVGFWSWLRYEVVTSLFGGVPGAGGLLLRKLFYPCLFASCGKGVMFGRHLVLRHPNRIQIGSGVVLADGVTLDAKGTNGEGILLRDGVFIGQGTIVTMADGTITLDERCNIGSLCRIGTFGNTRIGRKALVGAYCYIVGAYHESARTDIPIMDQPNRTKGGAQVGDGCWLGARVTVNDGVQVGHDSIVGAHAVVTKPLPPFSVSAGVPARVIRMRTDEAAASGQEAHDGMEREA